MSNYGLFVKGKMLGARQRIKLMVRAIIMKLVLALKYLMVLVVQSRIKLLFEFLRLSLTQV